MERAAVVIAAFWRVGQGVWGAARRDDGAIISLPGGDHWLLKSETRLAMLQASVDFVGKYDPVEGK